MGIVLRVVGNCFVVVLNTINHVLFIIRRIDVVFFVTFTIKHGESKQLNFYLRALCNRVASFHTRLLTASSSPGADLGGVRGVP